MPGFSKVWSPCQVIAWCIFDEGAQWIDAGFSSLAGILAFLFSVQVVARPTAL